jgi:hypothetical protein
MLPIFLSLNNQVKVIFKWIVSGEFPDQETVERAVIEKVEEEKRKQLEEPKKNKA